MDDSFKFFVDQVVGQYRELKSDLKTDLTEIKESMKEHQDDLTKLEARVSDLENFKSYMAGIAAFAVVLAEVVAKAVEYYLNK